MEIRCGTDKKGQSSIYDAMMSLSIMLVASGLVVGLSVHLMKADDVNEFEELHNYAGRLASALLSSTVPNASFLDVDGFEIVAKDISVQEMIVQEVLLLESGVARENFLGANGYDTRIEEVLSSLLDGDRFDCRLHGFYKSQEVAFGEELPDAHNEVAADNTEIHLPGEESIRITLYVWR